ncbi:MAG: hypothetical protein H7A23_12215 [Leptospiraceae bacterium]|nr:hypothetical protein [Leptospiraceae bacterium]MCP5495312.1 hypothetical protein [Leptospiraceae bacterium]
MNKLTIKQAIIKTMEKEGKPLTSQEVYNSIVKHNLYTFGAKDPKAVVNSEIRQHCEGLDLKTSKPEKLFKLEKDGKYSLLPR